MTRKVLVNGEEVDIGEVISGAPVPRQLFGDTPVSEKESDEEDQAEEKIDHLTVIVQITMRENLVNRTFGAGGYRFYR